jgi:hypothetical protein
MGHRGQPSTLTIVSLRSREPSFPTSPIQRQLSAAVEAACRAKGLTKRSAKTLSLLRCYLDVTSQRFRLRKDSLDEDRTIAIGFVTALRSPAFFEASPHSRYVHCSVWLKAGHSLGLIGDAEFAELRPPSLQLAASHATYVDTFQSGQLDPDMVNLWRGWKLVNASGYTCWPDLSKVYRKFGARWTADLHLAIAVWFRARKQNAIPVLNFFLTFIAETDSVSVDSLRHSASVTKMWGEFWNAYRHFGRGGKSRFCHLVNWKQWRDFATAALISPTLIARSLTELPGPSSVPRPYFGETESGLPDNLGLLDIRDLSELTDAEVMDFFIRETPRKLLAISKWADQEVSQVFMNYVAALRAGRHGQSRIIGAVGVNNGRDWLFNHANPDILANTSATLKSVGYLTAQDADLSILFPQSFRETSRLLGLPLRETMLPFAAILVAEHPKITPAFLEKLELFDRNGKPHGFQKIDGGWYLIGVKDRKGRRTSEQRIQLSERASAAIRKFIVITRLPREYLRRRQDDNWRFLFIATGLAFGYPRRTKFNSLIHYTKQRGEFQAGLLRAGVPESEIANLGSTFSLKELRKTVGLQVLLNTHSEREAADALGHQTWRPALIRRYLPETVLRLFRARWIRMFQNLVLIHTSPSVHYALKVTGFNNANEIEEFLAKSAFPHLRRMLNPTQEQELSDHGEFIFEASIHSVSAIRFLAGTDQEATPSPYWHFFAKHIMQILKERAAVDPAIHAILEETTA